MSIEKALEQLSEFIPTYQALSERDKFVLARVFNEQTGGKLSPFNSPSPVSVGIIPVLGPTGQTGFLGLRRAIAPCVGEVALPGGFLDPGEDPIIAMVREVQEEMSLDIDPASVWSKALVKMGHNNNMLMFFQSSEKIDYDVFMSANDKLDASDGEASELVIITPDTQLCFPLHQEAVNQAFVAQGMTPKVRPAKVFKP